ncbi:diguanylate cyclase (GGDEF)-like protein/PAS domain S-box-containing protein [Pararhizobium capsulatum DSM 1112]|uniref:Diguanylate cyclase (GGDEF)-like protein/PAS domain S-box-containing protein n=1 Tax=Pararhizobium capsulatum DSM 1112 TaxID=1121113 RepID=A0ABU0BUJ9_9HYPH|nr:diguanylate cyclase (GGDEF)-like protein/PAS domain S-box-containing protein [Pararhizobium capsulatum DSM 1112]
MIAELNPIRARLEASVNGDMQLVRGLIATMATEPNMTQERFAALSRNIFNERSNLRSIAAAPDLVVSLIYPLKGNEKALGLDYNKNEQQRAAALRVRDSGKLVLAGPLTLVQGGHGLIGRFPVYNDGNGAEKHFWGIVSAVIDVDKLYRTSGLQARHLKIDVAISGKDGLGEDGALFYGNGTVRNDDPVLMSVFLPGGSWQVGAVPKGGWLADPPNLWSMRLLLTLGGMIILVPMLITGRLMEERQANIHALQLNRHQLQELSHRLNIALDTSEIGIWELDITSNVLLWDERMKELYGFKGEGGQVYETWRNTLHPDDLQQAEAEFAQALVAEGQSYRSQFRLRLADGKVRHIRTIGSCYTDGEGRRKIVGVNWDVTSDVERNESLEDARRQAEAHSVELETARHRMEFNALHDPLTGLPNRRYLDQILATVPDPEEPRMPFAKIFHMDLDRFKEINDTLGHAAGDEILRHASRILRDNTGVDDFVARIGGDEFVIISRTKGTDTALARHIIEAMSVPILYNGQECRIGVSIGIAEQGSATEELTQVLVNADIALYEAKRRGRGRYEIFAHSLKTAVFKNKQTADEILRGLEQNEFIAYFQPQFCPVTLDIIGVEALARWDHPQKGILAPHAFLKTAEEINVLAEIDQRILEQALFQSRRWEASEINIPKVSVNLSYHRLHDENLIERLNQLSIPEGRVAFELLESISFDESDMTVLSNIEQIKNLGIDIEIDDFGTGYASIVSLLKLTPRRLKIDRQLVIPILTSPSQRQLVSSIIDIGTSLGIEVIAEGVETLEHAKILKDLGCHGLQGYAFARPMSPNELANFARERRWMAA